MKTRLPTQTISLLGIIIWVISLLSLHVLSPEINPLVDYISYYAFGNFPVLLCLSLTAIGVSALSISRAIWIQNSSLLNRLGSLCLAFWGLGSILAGIFPLDPVGADPTIFGMIHNIAGRNVILALPCLFLLELSDLKKSPNSQIRILDFKWTLMGLIALDLMFFFNTSLVDLGLGGLFQRLYWVMWISWISFQTILVGGKSRTGSGRQLNPQL